PGDLRLHPDRRACRASGPHDLHAPAGALRFRSPLPPGERVGGRGDRLLAAPLTPSPSPGGRGEKKVMMNTSVDSSRLFQLATTATVHCQLSTDIRCKPSSKS